MSELWPIGVAALICLGMAIALIAALAWFAVSAARKNKV